MSYHVVQPKWFLHESTRSRNHSAPTDSTPQPLTPLQPHLRNETFYFDTVDESDEFRRQNQLLKAHWGSSAVPVALEIPGCNHFSILDALVQPGSALNRLAMGLSQ